MDYKRHGGNGLETVTYISADEQSYFLLFVSSRSSYYGIARSVITYVRYPRRDSSTFAFKMLA